MIKALFTVGLAAVAIAMSTTAFAGNKDRAGQAGAPELLINPWAATTGVFGANSATIAGVEAMKSNIAGLAFVEKTDIGVSYNAYLKGSNINIYNLGFAQRLGNAGVVGANIMSVDYGDILITDYNNPTGGIGSYKPSFYNIQIGFAKEFRIPYMQV